METTRSTAPIAALSLFVFLTAVIVPKSADAQQDNPIQLTSTATATSHMVSQSAERMELLVKTSRILTLETRIPKFQVHNEEILGATPVSQNQLQIFAKMPGTTELNMWDENEKLYTVSVTVLADAREVEGILSTQLPLATLKVMPINASAIVSGYVTSVDDVDRAVAIVEQFYTTVVNNIKVVGVQQVLLHTRIMEVSRTKFRDLGIDWALIDTDSLLVVAPGGLIDATRSTLAGAQPVGDAANIRVFTNDFEGLISALRKQDLVKFLAEPTVVATHGRPARFTVGGKVPYIVPTGNGAVTINYEEFGTSVDFLPFVVGPGRIRLEVRPEVKEPDQSNSIESNGAIVPGFSQRYVETAVELQAGQTFAIAGLLQSRTEATTRSAPFFGELPFVGAAFRRVQERRNDIELLITVTPELVDALDPHEAPRGGPGLSSMSPNDHDLYWDGHIEVPNLKGGDGCSMPMDGFSTSPAMQLEPAIDHGAGVTSGAVYPPNAVVPGQQPKAVGDGVTVTSPSY